MEAQTPTNDDGSSGQTEESHQAEPLANADIFLTTRWTVVLTAGRSSAPQAQRALEELCATYWYPLYAYTRRQGHAREDAEDLVQGFFARFLEKNFLSGLTAEKGKFRAFLLASLKHFLANEHDRATRQKRGGGALHLSLDWQAADARYHSDFADPLAPDKLYDRAWAVTILERVVAQLRQEAVAEGKLNLFEQLKPYLTLAKGERPYAQTAATLALSEGTLRVAVHRLRRRYREALREEIVQTLSHPEQIEEEMRALRQAFSES